MADDLPDNLDLRWLGRTLLDLRIEMRDGFAQLRAEMASLRRDMDMTIRLVSRVDNTLNALREDVQALWLSQGDLRRRIEALEEK